MFGGEVSFAASCKRSTIKFLDALFRHDRFNQLHNFISYTTSKYVYLIIGRLICTTSGLMV
jgi:hypothetical protein